MDGGDKKYTVYRTRLPLKGNRNIKAAYLSAIASANIENVDNIHC
jgi:hypothetical protein